MFIYITLSKKNFEHTLNINGKNFIAFNTCRFISGKTLENLKAGIEKKGEFVANMRTSKGLFKIKMSIVEEFVEELNQKLIKPN